MANSIYKNPNLMFNKNYAYWHNYSFQFYTYNKIANRMTYRAEILLSFINRSIKLLS